MNYTTVDQSKKLLGLGLDPETSDCSWKHAPGYENYKGEITGFWDEPEWGQSGDSKDLPCWSLGALIELVPRINDNPFELIGSSGRRYVCGYTLSRNEEEEDKEYISFSEETAIDSVFDLVVWLLENNYIKIEKK